MSSTLPLPSSSSHGSIYSKAFEQLVDQPDDIEGLLAYALYKQTLHERAEQGMPVVSAESRFLASTEIATYRGKASNALKAFESIVIAREKDSIVSSGALKITEGISREIRGATAWWPSIRLGIVAGMAAWFLSLIITVVVASMAPEKAQAVAKILGLGR